MGAEASTDLAKSFFDAKEGIEHPPVNLSFNRMSRLAAEEHVKPGSSGPISKLETDCPLPQVGDGRGVTGKLRTVNEMKPRVVELSNASRHIRRQSKSQKVNEDKFKLILEPNKSPGQKLPAAKAEPKAELDIKPLIMMEEANKYQDVVKSVTSSSPQHVLKDKSVAMHSDSSMSKPDNQLPPSELNPPSQIQDIPQALSQSDPSLGNSNSQNFKGQPSPPVANQMSSVPVSTGESSFSQDEGKATLISDDVNKDTMNQADLSDQSLKQDQTTSASSIKLMSSIPNTGDDGTWDELAQQMLWDAMLRKGFQMRELNMSPDELKNVLSVYKANSELAWSEVVKWESLHADECKEPKLKKFESFATKYSPRARLRSWLGYELPFDRHDWIIDRNGKEIRYVIDYYDGGKFNDKFEFALLDVRPALDSFEALWDRMRVAFRRWTSWSDDNVTQADPASLSSVTEPLNLGKKPVADDVEKLLEKKPSQFMPYDLSDVKEREEKNSVG